jgi:hypothetical protein
MPFVAYSSHLPPWSLFLLHSEWCSIVTCPLPWKKVESEESKQPGSGICWDVGNQDEVFFSFPHVKEEKIHMQMKVSASRPSIPYLSAVATQSMIVPWSSLGGKTEQQACYTKLNWGCVQIRNIWGKNSCNTFVVIWQNLSNHELIRLKRFISTFTDKLYN